MKFFLDTEFSERGAEYPIELISIGLVAENGNEFYAVAEFNRDNCNDWVKENVLPNLHKISGGHASGGGDSEDIIVVTPLPRAVIASMIFLWVHDQDRDEKPEFWGYFCDYDWVVLCQLFGTMMELPPNWPKYCLDVKQLAMSKGKLQLPKQEIDIHNALEDARWTKQAYESLHGLTHLSD